MLRACSETQITVQYLKRCWGVWVNTRVCKLSTLQALVQTDDNLKVVSRA